MNNKTFYFLILPSVSCCVVAWASICAMIALEHCVSNCATDDQVFLSHFRNVVYGWAQELWKCMHLHYDFLSCCTFILKYYFVYLFLLFCWDWKESSLCMWPGNFFVGDKLFRTSVIFRIWLIHLIALDHLYHNTLLQNYIYYIFVAYWSRKLFNFSVL